MNVSVRVWLLIFGIVGLIEAAELKNEGSYYSLVLGLLACTAIIGSEALRGGRDEHRS